MEDYMLPCMFKQTFGFDCMGCGLQRALYLLVQGDFYGAFVLYPPVYTLLLLLGITVRFALKPTQKNGRQVLFTALLNVIVILGAYCIKMKDFFF